MEWVHGPEDPVAEALVVAVVPDGEDLCSGSVEGNDVTVGEVPGFCEVHLGEDGWGVECWGTDGVEGASG